MGPQSYDCGNVARLRLANARPGGTAIASATIDRTLQQETITATLTVEPTSFTAGQSIMLSWKTTNATSGAKC